MHKSMFLPIRNNRNYFHFWVLTFIVKSSSVAPHRCHLSFNTYVVGVFSPKF